MLSVILLSGGQGRRFGSDLPKQYHLLADKPVALYSLELFLSLPEVGQVVVVCHSTDESYFEVYRERVRFAASGPRRQDSLASGLSKLDQVDGFAAIHDAARPFVSEELVRRVLKAAGTFGAAAPGLPVRGTVKRLSPSGFVTETMLRDRYWEMQTPQILDVNLLRKGLLEAERLGVTVTDDAALAELLGERVKIVEGTMNNLKLTQAEDLLVAEALLETALR